MNYLFPKHVNDFDSVLQNSIQAFKFDTTILEKPLSAVFYTDGGYRAAMHYRQAPPEVGGYGIFGYVYTEDQTKVGHGLSGVSASVFGLVKNPSIDVELIDRNKYPNQPVSVLAYIQMMDASFDFKSNNITEVLATMNAFDLASKLNLGRICIKTDSRYVLQGLIWCKKWSENGWLKASGEPVANRELWETIYGLYTNLIEQNVIVDLMWVQGHSDSVGNCYADSLATKSMISLVNGHYPGMVEFHDPKGFWNPKVDINPLLLEKHVVFDSFSASRNIHTERGRYTLYTLGNLGDGQEEYTKIMSDKALSVVALSTPEPSLEILSTLANNSMSTSSDFYNENSIYVGRLDIIQKPNAYNEIAEKGDVFLRKDMFSNEFSLHNKMLVLEEINPVRLGEHTIHQEYNNLSDMLVSYIKDSQAFGMNFHMSDITDQIYEVIESKKKDIFKVKPDIDKHVNVLANVRLSHELRNTNTLLLTGRDLPKVRVLNKIAASTTKVFLVSWAISNKAYRHATLIESEFGIGIWSGVYSNLKQTA